ncbi:arylsulfatase A-like enzyme [Lewinella aquimaris]|uniref:Arylsulfatase A-like enzyme n=1 Tax=Neolewinella aquimaris TaxID=1835722 RepID=A0A840E9Z1_9BACT|nr:sulfatase [Neolewinella aquimaris]MBB4078629.1 arylsulfatase A-like enzyme [Neolewinella aquimaris]
MRTLTLLLCLLAAFTLHRCNTATAATSVTPGAAPLNIIYIMSDDHTTQAVGAYGSRLAPLNPTPNLDALAREGTLFTSVFCTNSICTPSRGNIMTGQYSQTNGIRILDDTLPPARQYLPLEMKKLGYQTAMIGKWHLKAEPAAYDYYQVLESQGRYFDPEFRSSTAGQWPDNMVSYEGHSSDVITDITLDWLKSKRDKQQPFFLMHHYKAPHDDFEFAPRYADYLEDTYIPEPANLYPRNEPGFGSEATRGSHDSLIHEIGTSVSDRHTYRNYVDQYGIAIEPRDAATSAGYQQYLKNYLRCVKGVDDNLKRLFDYLKAEGLWENTLIVYTGDQGMMLGEHDYIDKRWMYEESMRMPFIVRHPGGGAGATSDLLINNTDFAPTLIEWAGGTTPNYMQGKSFARYIDGSEPADWRTATYYRYWMHLTHHDVPAHFGVRTKKYKLIFYYSQPYRQEEVGRQSMSWIDESYKIRPTPVAWEFYDLSKDPYESFNRYGDPAYTETIRELKVQLKQLRTDLNETDQDAPDLQRLIDANWDA